MSLRTRRTLLRVALSAPWVRVSAADPHRRAEPAPAAPDTDAADASAPRAFAFALIGDLPYGDAGEPDLPALLAALDAEPLAFVLHVGDIKGGSESCADALLARRVALLARSAHPLVLLPGDNDWTDCHRRAAGGFDPSARLDVLRRLAWASPTPLGARGPAAGAALAFERQAGQPENVRWRIGAVHCVALHVVGSGNGRDGWQGSRAAHDGRMARNRVWLRAAVRHAFAARADALVIAAHADPDFDREPPHPGFADWIDDLREAAQAFPRPILLLHGDSHRFRVDRPLRARDGRRVDHLTRVVCFGWPLTASWVRIGYDATRDERFVVTVRDLGEPPSRGGA